MGDYADRTDRVLQGLERAVQLSGASKDDEALVLLQSLKPDVAALREATRGMNEAVKSEEDFAQERLTAALQALAAAHELEATLREQVAAMSAERSADAAGIEEAQRQLAGYQAEMVRLQQRISDLADELHDHQSKMATWWWVPGYNVYLAVENIQDLIDGKEGELDSVRHSFQDVAARLPELQGDLNRLNQAIAALDNQLTSLVGQESQLAARMGMLELAQKAQSAAVATSAAAASFYTDLDVSLADVENDLESTYNLAERLADPVEIMAGNELRPGTLEQALHDLAVHADAASQRLDLFSNSPGGQYSSDVVIGTEPAGGYSRTIVFVPFTVDRFVHLRGVVMPFKGTDMIIQLGTGQPIPAATTTVVIPEPTILASRAIPGRTDWGGMRDIGMPGARVLAPNQQYFILLSAANLDIFAGTWTQSSQASHYHGQRFRTGEWLLFAPGRGAPILQVYGTAAVGLLQV